MAGRHARLRSDGQSLIAVTADQRRKTHTLGGAERRYDLLEAEMPDTDHGHAEPLAGRLTILGLAAALGRAVQRRQFDLAVFHAAEKRRRLVLGGGRHDQSGCRDASRGGNDVATRDLCHEGLP